MTFFEDCDLILKLYYDHFFNGPFDENRRQIWDDLDDFERLCKGKLEIKSYGYINAIHHQLESEGYIKPLGELGELTKKNHYMTPKGFSFCLTGGFKKQIEDIQTQEKYVRISAKSTQYGTIAQWFFGILSLILSGFALYVSLNNESVKTTINALKKDKTRKSQEHKTKLLKPSQAGKHLIESPNHHQNLNPTK